MNNEVSFRDFLLKDRWNRRWLWVAAISVVVQFGVFKYLYPFASYIYGDSFAYLNTAIYNKSINTYMIGYSMFIRIFSVFSNWDAALAAFQYLLVVGSSLGLLFTIFYFYQPSKTLRVILLCFMLYNPLFLYMGNMVSSDAFFLGLSLIWVTLLIWIMQRPSWRLILWHTAIIYIAFTTRYNALIYLFIAAAAFSLSRMTVWKKVVGIGAAALAIGLFVLNTGNQYKKLTGIWEYSPFAGWQWTNNAMYAYRYVDSAHRKPVPARFQPLDNMVRQYFDSTRDVKKFPTEALMASTVYMWSPGLTLFKYRDSLFKKDSTASELKKWSSMGPLYKDYGLYIIRQYPLHFLRYFIWPNAVKYYAPPVEFLQTYNGGNTIVPLDAVVWFGYKTQKVFTRVPKFEAAALGLYPILSGTINVLVFFSLLSFLLLDGLKQKTPLRDAVLLGVTIWLLNAGFTILSSSAALRFQSFPLIISTIYAGLLIDWLRKMATMKSEPEKARASLKILPV